MNLRTSPTSPHPSLCPGPSQTPSCPSPLTPQRLTDQAAISPWLLGLGPGCALCPEPFPSSSPLHILHVSAQTLPLPGSPPSIPLQGQMSPSPQAPTASGLSSPFPTLASVWRDCLGPCLSPHLTGSSRGPCCPLRVPQGQALSGCKGLEG